MAAMTTILDARVCQGHCFFCQTEPQFGLQRQCIPGVEAAYTPIPEQKSTGVAGHIYRPAFLIFSALMQSHDVASAMHRHCANAICSSGPEIIKQGEMRQNSEDILLYDFFRDAFHDFHGVCFHDMGRRAPPRRPLQAQRQSPLSSAPVGDGAQAVLGRRPFERSHNEAVRVETGRILQPRESRAPARHTDHGNYFTTGPEPPRATRPAPNDAVAVDFSYRL